MATTVTPPSVIKVQVGSQQAPTVSTLQSTMSIKGASDFVLGTPNDGDVLVYNTSNGNFTLTPQTGGGGGGGTNYTNANVAAYLPEYGGTVNAAALFYNGDYINIASDVGFQLQYDPSQTYNPYDLKNGSWLYFDATGLTWQSNVTGHLDQSIYFDNAGNLTASGTVTANNFVGVLKDNHYGYQQVFLQSNGAFVQTSLNNLGETFYTWRFDNTEAKMVFPDGTSNYGSTVIAPQDYDIQSIRNTLIQTSASAGAKTWTFDTSGNVTFPDNSVQVTAYTGFGTDNTSRIIAQAAYVQANTANTVAIASYVQANTANTVAIASFVRANTANTVAIASYVQANTATTIGQASYVQANTANTVAIASYVQANTATTIGQAAFARANSEIIGTAAYVQANTSNTVAIAAYVQANTATIIGQAGYGQANIATTIAQASYSQVNTTQTFAQSAYDTANAKFNSTGGTISGNVVIQNNLTVNGNLNILGSATTINTSSIVLNDPLIYLAANNYTSDVVDIGIIGHYNDGTSAHTGMFRDPVRKEWIFFKGYVPEVQSNNVINIADPSFAYANVNASVFKGNLSGYVTFTDGTTQITAASPSVYSVAAYGQANTATIIGQAGYGQANIATTIAQAAYVQANTSNTVAIASYVQANTATTIGQAAFSRANSEIIGTAAYVQANTANTVAIASYVQANTATTIGQAAYVQANTANTVAISSYVQANTAAFIGTAAFVQANTSNTVAIAAYVQANTANTVAIASYVQANTATTIAQAAYGRANSEIIGTAAYVQANTANTVAIASYVQANTATIIGQAAYSTANLKFDTAGGTITGNTTINANLIVTGANVSLGNVGNIHIYGGNTGQLLITDGQGNINWTDLPTPNTVTYTANSLIQTNGVYVSGNLWSTQVFGDYLSTGGTYVLTDGSGTAPAWYIDFDFINVIKFNRVVLNINYTASSGHTIYVQLYNNLTAAWDSIGTYTGLGSYYAFALEVIDEANYLNSGRVQLRLYHSNAGNTGHQTNIDYVALEQSIQGPQGPRGPTGATGATGATGNGVPIGGTTGQVLIKNSATNYDTVWSDNLTYAYNTANLAFTQANTATIIAQAAFAKANTGGSGSSSGYLPNSVIFANTTGYLSNVSSLQYFSSNNTFAVNGLSTINYVGFPGSQSIVLTIAGANTKGGIGYVDFLQANNNSLGATNPNKFFRLDSTGQFQIINSAYNANIFNLTDAGLLSVPSLTLNSGGGGQIVFQDGTTQSTAASGAATDQTARNLANTATFIGQASFVQANTSNTVAIAAYVQANTANTVAIASYVQANTATIIGQAAYVQANTSNTVAIASYVQANTANTVAIASYVQANTATIIGQAAFVRANSEIIGTAAYIQANTSNTVAIAAYVQANTANTVAIASYVQANTATIIGQAAYVQANTSNTVVIAAYVQANTSNTVAIAAYVQANTATTISQAAFVQANTSNTVAIAAYVQANTSNTVAIASYVQANTATIIGQAAYVQANTANTVAIASYVQANTSNTVAIASYVQANTATIIGQAAYVRANSEIIGTAAYVQANTSNTVAIAAYVQANTANTVAIAAYVQANTATIIAQAAYAQANTGGPGGASSNSFATILVSGQSDVIANTPTGRLTFVAGSGMTITTAQTSNTITFASTGGFSGGTIANQLTIANSTPSISNGTGALIVQGGVGVTGNIYIGASSVLGFANNASNSVVYQVYNATTNSLDTIFG